MIFRILAEVEDGSPVLSALARYLGLEMIFRNLAEVEDGSLGLSALARYLEHEMIFRNLAEVEDGSLGLSALARYPRKESPRFRALDERGKSIACQLRSCKIVIGVSAPPGREALLAFFLGW